jgi:hypothetical protein
MSRFHFALAGFITLLPSLNALAAEPSAADLQFFEKKIRPVLIERCYSCHSAKAQTEKKLEGQLLLDSRAGIRKGGETGPAIVPGDVKKSLLIQAIRHESVEMPPKSKLPDNVIADFVKWVEMGAPDPRNAAAVLFPDSTIDLAEGRKFWSFQLLKQPIPPKVRNAALVRTPVDQFILAKQEAAGIPPNEAASRSALIRRVYFDIWGLPPEPAEIAAFVADSSPEAYTRLVDRLLEGTHYGERWGRHWLDLARFAESNGYAFDKDRPAAFHYRDFVIKALNEDMPYDQFLRLQIAGDLQGGNDYMSQAATGFIAAGPFTSQQTQKERERSRYEQLDDLISTIGTATMGLTLGCSRCHDHKFDPVPSYDYYRMIASFSETGFQDFQLDLEPERYKKEKATFGVAHKPFVDARGKFEREQLPQRLAKWLVEKPTDTIRPKLSDWSTVGPFTAADFEKAFAAASPPEKRVDLKQTFQDGKLKWIAQPSWVDGKVHNTLTGDNSANYLFRTIEVPTAGPLEISLGRDDAIKVWLNGKVVLSKKTSGAAAPDQDKIKLALKAGRNELLLKIVNGAGPSGFYFKASDGAPPKNIQDILALADDKRNPAQKQALQKWFAPYDADWIALNKAEKDHLAKAPKQKLQPIFAARKGGVTYNFGADTRKVYFLTRGNSKAKKGLASTGFIQVLMNGADQEKHWTVDKSTKTAPVQPSRVAFANWLTDAENGAGHLVARVIVNRLWQHHFGRGIVGTPSDFGSQGDRPTHPELLDYLASELIRGAWKLKPIHKLIMTSATYRQSGRNDAAGMKQDPGNKLWWRRPSQRVEAEIVRDSLLTISGQLDKKQFGPGSLNQEDRRRSVYLKVKRGTLIPILQLFDAPDAMQSIGARTMTTVPPQALAMMNSPFVRRLATTFAKRVQPNDKSALPKVVDDAYVVAYARRPSDEERQRMLAFIDVQAKSYGENATSVETAVADFCQLLICSNEFLFVD